MLLELLLLLHSDPTDPPAVYRDLILDFYNANYFHRERYASKAEGGTATADERG